MHVSRGCDACTKAQQPTQRPSVNEPRGGTRCRERQRGPGSASSRGAATIPEKWPALAHSLFFRFAARRDAALCSSTQRFSSDTVRVAAARRLVMLVMSGSIFLLSFFLPFLFIQKLSPRSKNFQVSAKRELSHGKEKEGKEGKREKGRGGSEGTKRNRTATMQMQILNTYMHANINYFYERYYRIGHPRAWATCH